MKNKKRQKRALCNGIQRIKPQFKRVEPVKSDDYKTFPGVTQQCLKYQTFPLPYKTILYKSLSRKMYIYKHDLFVKLQHATCWNFRPYDPIHSLIVYYLRTMVQSLKGRCELVKYDEEPFDALQSKIKKETRPLTARNDEDRKWSLTKMMKEVKKNLLPENQLDHGYMWFYSSRRELRKMEEVQNRPGFNSHTMLCFLKVRELVEKFVKKRPNWFKPNSHGRRTKKPIVRLFNDCVKGENIRFVFDKELSTEMRSAGMIVNPIFQKAETNMGVSLFSEVFAMLREQMRNIEFVQVSMNKIWDDGPPGFKYEPKAGQYFLGHLKREIERKQIFHGATRQQAREIVQLFEKTAQLIESFMVGPSLFNDELYGKWQQYIFEMFEPYHHSETYEENKSTKFTRKDFCREIRRCGLQDALPGIMKYIDENIVIAHLIEKDFYYTLVMSQAMWVIEESKDIQEFLHKTNCCEYFGNECSRCATEKTEIEADTGNGAKRPEKSEQMTSEESINSSPEALKNLQNQIHGIEQELRCVHNRKTRKELKRTKKYLTAKVENQFLKERLEINMAEHSAMRKELSMMKRAQKIVEVTLDVVKEDVTASFQQCLIAEGYVPETGSGADPEDLKNIEVEQLVGHAKESSEIILETGRITEVLDPISKATSAESKAIKNKEKRGRKSANRNLKNVEQEARNNPEIGHCGAAQTPSQIEDDAGYKNFGKDQFQDFEKMIFEGLLRDYANVGQSSSNSETAPPMDTVEEDSHSEVSERGKRQSEKELEQSRSQTDKGEDSGNLAQSTDAGASDPAENEMQLLQKQLKELQRLKFENEKTIEKLKKATFDGNKAAKNEEKRGRKAETRKLKNLEREARNDSKLCDSPSQKEQTPSQIEGDTEGRSCDNNKFNFEAVLEKKLFEALILSHAKVGQSKSTSKTALPTNIVDSKVSDSKTSNNMNEEERQFEEELEQTPLQTDEDAGGEDFGNLAQSTDDDASEPTENEMQLLQKQLKELQWLKFENEKTIERWTKYVRATSDGSKAAKNKEKRGRKAENKKLKNLGARNDPEIEHCDSPKDAEQTLSQIEDDSGGKNYDNDQFQDHEKMVFEGLLREHPEVGQSSFDSNTEPSMDVIEEDSKVSENQRQSTKELEQAPSQTDEDFANLAQSTDSGASEPTENEIQLLQKQLKELQWLKFENEKTIEKLKKDVKARDNVITTYQRIKCSEMCPSASDSSEMFNLLFAAITVRDSLDTNRYIEKNRDRAFEIMTRSKNKQHQLMAKKELARVEKEFTKIKNATDKLFQWAKNGKWRDASEFSKLPRFPRFSNEFWKAYKEVLNMEFLETVEGTRCEASEELNDLATNWNQCVRDIEQLTVTGAVSRKDTKLSFQMKLKLRELTDQLENLKNNDPVKKAKKMALEWEGFLGPHYDPAGELKGFLKNIDDYKRRVKKTIEWVKSHPEADIGEVPKLPEQPVFKIHVAKH